ncbi:F0F1 ATP synthase subunit B' [Pseudaestuariivita atlantica]|uniref:ATP synthase subunit b n=1 Tax=Pseudaestuariivita atlantica TaxID=1317121 RepID=A0A0L1JTJ7_9RHOB|nr:F0F1 ATP synthase subunit B' [Pseudaestuariivita atlantica]KNG94743.1 ATP F0F1 synthase subunit B' [Pseudaestuariivita atlantica]
MAEDTHATDGMDKTAEAPGMPQLDFSTFDNQIFWLVIALVAIYLILNRIALPRIASVLAERKGTVTNDIAKAEELKQAAVTAEENYKKALADARAEAQEIVAKAKADIQADLDDALAKADAEIAARSAESEKAIAEIRAGAMDAVAEVARETAAELVAVLGGKPDKAAIDAAVAERMKG